MIRSRRRRRLLRRVRRWGPIGSNRPLGAGGMGEVYKARDTRLDRSVAIKVLPAAFANEPELRQRFEREAQAISALSHPHICALYDIGTTRATSSSWSWSISRARRSRQRSEGPAAARSGAAIRHRDRRRARQGAPRGHRASRPEAGQRDADEGGREAARLRPGQVRRARRRASRRRRRCRRRRTALTSEGTIVGTFQYMAPEQLEGKGRRRTKGHVRARRACSTK